MKLELTHREIAAMQLLLQAGAEALLQKIAAQCQQQAEPEAVVTPQDAPIKGD